MAEDIRSDDELWNEFHRVVNMTSRELDEWLRTRSAGAETEELPDQAGTPTGQQVSHVLSKRRTDLQEGDLQVMRKVVSRVYHERRADLEPETGDAGWRYRLMSIGHDPMKPPGN